MRPLCTFSLTLSLALGFGGLATAKHQLELTDDGLPLQELRPMDRRVYILTLDGKWEQPPAADTTYYLNYFFADGGSYSHKVDDVPMFRKGEVRCIIQGYQLTRHGVARGGKFSVAVSAGREVTSPEAPEVISNVKELTWPMERRVIPFRVQSKHSPQPPVDELLRPGEELARPPYGAKPRSTPPAPPTKKTAVPKT